MKIAMAKETKKTIKVILIAIAVVTAVVIGVISLPYIINIAIDALSPSVFRYKGNPNEDYSASTISSWDSADRANCIVRDGAVFYGVDSTSSSKIRRVFDGENRVVYNGQRYAEALDQNTLVLRHNRKLALYNIDEKSYTDIGDYFLISAGDGKVYCYTSEETDELHQDDTRVFEYNVEDGNINEILHFVGTWVSYDHHGLFFTDYFVHKYFSFEDKEIKTKFEDIEWTDLKNVRNDNEHSFAWLGDKILHTTDNVIEVYDLAAEEMITVLDGRGTRLICASITEDAVYYSNWMVDIAFWPLKDEKNGTYKYSFETGETEKISNKKYYYVVAIEEDVLVVEGSFGRIKKVKVK